MEHNGACLEPLILDDDHAICWQRGRDPSPHPGLAARRRTDPPADALKPALVMRSGVRPGSGQRRMAQSCMAGATPAARAPARRSIDSRRLSGGGSNPSRARPARKAAIRP
ncbi:hypothetical protein H696_02932 [Fonticula alba]|uniref:Uncharacterized protein n=1 Tax=Fonticula alba TaxID=691883 RepID=A0A058Z8G5_FONAL|nr:hypothetical protein H696_02932 [Fonticula alba]KCV70584.1 hypothetical protein H696_02932 [Fonticula alba]|eukprot:XP_009495100.1 hypothetical protein H696_02932 [Fonticula alba]